MDPRELLLTPDEPEGWISCTTWICPESKRAKRRLVPPAVFRRLVDTNRAVYRTSLREWLRRLVDGSFRPDYVVWEFDSAEDVSLAFRDAYRLVQLLKEMGVLEEWLTIFYSGRKGVAVLLPAAFFCPQAAGKEEWAAAAAIAVKRICGAVELPTADITAWRGSQPLRWFNVVHLGIEGYRILMRAEDLRREPAEVRERAMQGPADVAIDPNAPPPAPCPRLVEIFREALEQVQARPVAKRRARRRAEGIVGGGGLDDELDDTTKELRASLPFATFVSPAPGRPPVLVIVGLCPACLSEPVSASGAEAMTGWITDRTHRLKCMRAKCRASSVRAGEKGLRPDEWIPLLVPEAYGGSGLELTHAAEVNGAWADSQLKESAEVLPPVVEARQVLQATLRAAIQGTDPEAIIVEATPGVGKTVTTAREV
ncbi:MAG: hypothetical protein K8T20_04735, partial [Planctomycetes bacterium]|nr:hypothetical protein [Planctomycetota bacterium]